MQVPQTTLTQQPGTLVLLRHAQSLWNPENRSSGWAGIGLSTNGIDEALRAGAALRRHGITFDVAFVSRLARATRTLEIVLDELGQRAVPVIADWRLNERHYGALQALNKAQTAERYGAQGSSSAGAAAVGQSPARWSTASRPACARCAPSIPTFRRRSHNSRRSTVLRNTRGCNARI